MPEEARVARVARLFSEIVTPVGVAEVALAQKGEQQPRTVQNPPALGRVERAWTFASPSSAFVLCGPHEIQVVFGDVHR